MRRFLLRGKCGSLTQCRWRASPSELAWDKLLAIRSAPPCCSRMAGKPEVHQVGTEWISTGKSAYGKRSARMLAHSFDYWRMTGYAEVMYSVLWATAVGN